MIRSLAESMSKNVSFWRRLPAEFGRVKVRVSPESGGLRYWMPNISRVEPFLFDFVRETVKPGMSVWDIGANIGLLTFAAAAKAGAAGQVIAVEPDVDNQKLMFRTIRANGSSIAEVTLLGVAVGNSSQRFAKFEISGRCRASNKLTGYGNTQFGRPAESRTVIIVSLDEMLDRFRPPEVVKIDVEGAEVDVLQGGSKLLNQIRPIWTIEVNKENRDAMSKLLLDANYLLYDGEKPRSERKLEPATCWNTIAVPREKAASFGYIA